MTSYTMTTYNHEDWFEAERFHRAGRDGDTQEIGRLILLGYDVNLFNDMCYHRCIMPLKASKRRQLKCYLNMAHSSTPTTMRPLVKHRYR